jgi:hypothetical protein
MSTSIDWRNEQITPSEILAIEPMPRADMMLRRLSHRDVWGDEHNVLEYLIASADWHNQDGLRCSGAIPPIVDIATVLEVPELRALDAFATLVNTRIVDLYEATPTYPNGSYWVELERLEPRGSDKERE